MKRKNKFLALLTSLAVIGGCLIVTPNLVMGQSTSAGEVDAETVKENIKKRIEQAVEEKKEVIEDILGQKSQVKRAWVGQLESLANGTLTLKVESETRMASVSAETAIVTTPGNKPTKVTDLAIGEYLILMGYVNGNEVMETRRVIASSESPVEKLEYKPFWGKLTAVDEDQEILTMVNPKTEEELKVEVIKKSVINQEGDEGLEEVEVEDLIVGQMMAVIYLPGKDAELASLTQARLVSQPTEETEVEGAATESGELEASPTPQITPKQQPAELGE